VKRVLTSVLVVVAACCGVARGAEAVASGAAPALAAAATNAPAEKPAGKRSAKGQAGGRESIITANKSEFDNKEGVILFDENVFVDDEQFLMRADRLLVFLEGTNDVQQLMAVGRVSITNENRAASCEKEVYTKKEGQIVMTGNARLVQKGGETGEVTGDRIVIWVDDQRMEVYPARVVLPPGTLNKGDHKLLP
jgi:lipopolysaccharide transport protein LptA